MPLTDKGQKVLGSMKKTYGSDRKAKEVFYASMNKGKPGSASWHKGGGSAKKYAGRKMSSGRSATARRGR